MCMYMCSRLSTSQESYDSLVWQELWDYHWDHHHYHQYSVSIMIIGTVQHIATYLSFLCYLIYFSYFLFLRKNSIKGLGYRATVAIEVFIDIITYHQTFSWLYKTLAKNMPAWEIDDAEISWYKKFWTPVTQDWP